MAWTQTDADALKAAIATGAVDVTYSDGSRVTYRSLADMRQTLALIQTDIAQTAGTRTTKTVRVNSRKGF